MQVDTDRVVRTSNAHKRILILYLYFLLVTSILCVVIVKFVLINSKK